MTLKLQVLSSDFESLTTFYFLSQATVLLYYKVYLGHIIIAPLCYYTYRKLYVQTLWAVRLLFDKEQLQRGRVGTRPRHKVSMSYRVDITLKGNIVIVAALKFEKSAPLKTG